MSSYEKRTLVKDLGYSEHEAVEAISFVNVYFLA